MQPTGVFNEHDVETFIFKRKEKMTASEGRNETVAIDATGKVHFPWAKWLVKLDALESGFVSVPEFLHRATVFNLDFIAI